MSELGELHYPVEKPKDLESSIHESERKLGLYTSYDRLKEASLFIDKKFMDFSVITGSVDKPERMFGDAAWADYLEGRNFAKTHGKKDLTTDFITSLHSTLVNHSDKEKGGKIRDRSVRATAFDDIGSPVTYTDRQLTAIKENPLIYFDQDSPDDDHTGYIMYPHSGERTKELIEKELEKICTWFNEAKRSERYDPFIVAGTLQQKIATLHPFEDKNGSLSRILMNWSLGNDGESPSILAKPEEDIVTDSFDWIARTWEGSKRYKKISEKQTVLEKLDIQNKSALLGLSEEQAFYEYIFQYVQKSPTISPSEDVINHKDIESYLEGLAEERKKFAKEFEVSSPFHIDSVFTTELYNRVHQGGLITSEYRNFVTSPKRKVVGANIMKDFFSDIEVYRGASIDEEINETDIFAFFDHYTGVGSSYKAAGRAKLFPTSMKEVDTAIIDDSMDTYNKLIAAAYLKDISLDDDIPPPNSYDGDDLGTISNLHVRGRGIECKSPFLSCSTDHHISQAFSGQIRPNAIVFTFDLPKQGILSIHNTTLHGITPSNLGEKELLVAGGIVPESIRKIEIFNRYRMSGISPIYVAWREQVNGKEGIVVDDKRGPEKRRKKYIYDESEGTYIIVDNQTNEEDRTEIEHPSFPPMVSESSKNNLQDAGKIFIDHDIYDF